MSQFGELLEKLARAEVRYVLVGGAAVLLHGYARFTADIDILVEANEENARRLLSALATWGSGAGAELTIEELATPQMGALRIFEGFALDVFTLMPARKSGRNLQYADLADDSLRATISGGIEVPYASAVHLAELKAGTGRPKDALDIAALSEIARGRRERSPVDLAAMEADPTATAADSEQGDWPLTPGGERSPRH